MADAIRAVLILAALLTAPGLSPRARADAIYAIRPDGQLLFYRYAGMADGSFNWAVEQKVIGSGWQGLSQVFAGDNGAIYAIKPDGQMLFYRYAGLHCGLRRRPGYGARQQ